MITGYGVIGHTTLGWAVSVGDAVTCANGGSCTVLGREGNLILAQRFTPGKRTFIGRTHGRSEILKLHPSEVGMKSIEGSLPIYLSVA